MGLNIISTTSASSSLAASPAAGVLAEGLPGEFASLLSGQTLAALMSQPGIGNAGGTDAAETRRRDDVDEDAENNGILGMDPAALVALLGNAQLQPGSTPRVDGPANQPGASSATSLSRTTSALLNNPTETEPDAKTKAQLPSAASGHGGRSLPEAGNDLLPAIGAASEKAAIIAGAPPENPGEATSFATGLTVAAQQRGISTEVQTTTAKPAHTETWPQQFSEKIVWMAKNDQQTAQINITPPQLGPVQITLNLNGDSANVLFASPHAEVRQVIESSLPQLREMLASAGISLGESNVGANLAQQNQNNQFMMANKNQSTHENAILPANEAVPTASSGQVPKAGRGLVDLFA
jgi:flagellar hook-length control protein FliK